MNIKELIELLKGEDPERIVIMASDSEGNSYSPLSTISTCSYFPETKWSGEVGMEGPLDEGLKELGYTEEDIREGGQPALIFSPTN